MNWIHYLVEANLYMAAFYALYLIFLRGETHYQLNRAYLLGTNLLAFLIPFVQLGILKPAVQISTQISVGSLSDYSAAIAPSGTAGVAATEPWAMDDYILLIYGLVAIVLLISLCIRVYLLMALLKKGSVTKSHDYNLIELHQGSVAFSFFNNLFIDDRLASSQTILYHEQVHIRQKHSWDIIYLEIVKIINWFNPVVYLMIASMKEVHEFIADEATAGLENNNDSYTDFLISNAYGITQNSLTNSFFNKNLLKRRITMLYQKKSGDAAKLKYLLALPLICGLLCLSTLAFTTKTYAWVIAPHQVDATSKATNSIATKHKTNLQQHDENTQPVGLQGNVNYTIDPSRYNENELKEIRKNLHKQGYAMDFREENNVANGKLLTITLSTPPQSAWQRKAEATFRVADMKDLNIVVGADADNRQLFVHSAPKADTQSTDETTKTIKTTGPALSPSISDDKVQADTEKVFKAAQVVPQFPGGIPALTKFVQTNVRYPKEDHDNKVQGRAYIQFVVEQDGSLDNFRIIRAPSEAMGKEAMRVMASSPKWAPGTQNGKPVRVEFTMPINFSLSNDGPNAPFNINILPPPPPAAPVKQDGNNFHLLPPPPVKEVEANANTVYTAVEIQPEFPGGEAGFAKFLQKTIRYPATAKQNRIQGKVYVQFVVEKDGSITDIKVIREPGSGTGDEAVRVMKLSPKWIPGKLNGQPVRVQFTLPIDFSLGY